MPKSPNKGTTTARRAQEEYGQTAQYKADFYTECGNIEADLFDNPVPNRWSELANTVLELAEDVENAEIQQEIGGGGNGDNPSTAPPRFDLGK